MRKRGSAADAKTNTALPGQGELPARQERRVPTASAGEEPIVIACGTRFMTALKIALRFVPPEGCPLEKERMRGVQIQLRGCRLTICATDGHRLMRWQQEVTGDAPEVSITLTPESVEAVLIASLRKHFGLLHFFTRSKRLVAGEVEVKVEESKQTFPRWEDIVRNAQTGVPKGVQRIGMNASYAAEALGAFQAACSSPEIKRDERPTPNCKLEFMSDMPNCKLEFMSDMDPIVVTSPSVPELFVLVMPVRL